VRLHYNGTLRTVVTAAEIPASGELRVAAGAIVTPSARDLAIERGVKIVELAAGQLPAVAPPEKTVALGADHGGFQMKELLKPVLAELGFAVYDCGVAEETPADYPDIALKVAEMVAGGQAARGVIIDGAGNGSAMAANKVPGIRAALCYDRSTARSSREHNDSNVLTLGGRLLTATQAEEVLRTWMATPFGGGRHAARIRKITEIEKRYATWTARNSNNS
jgi:ribose 5-phosphate isomerase B